MEPKNQNNSETEAHDEAASDAADQEVIQQNPDLTQSNTEGSSSTPEQNLTDQQSSIVDTVEKVASTAGIVDEVLGGGQPGIHISEGVGSMQTGNSNSPVVTPQHQENAVINPTQTIQPNQNLHQPNSISPSNSIKGFIFVLIIGLAIIAISYRSEEHTSELQSLRHLVCR